MRRLLPFLVLLGLVIAASTAGVVQSDAATAQPAPEAALGGVAQVDGGLYFSCARTTAGQVRCWGANDTGQLGDGTIDDRPSPVTVLGPDGTTPLTGVRQVATGDRFACARLTGGTVACWGRNVYGQLGDGGATEQHHAVLVHGVGGAGTLTGVRNIALGDFTSCASTTAGQVRCWGDGEHGQLGHGQETSYQPTPVVVQNPAGSGPLTGVTRVTASHHTVCARLRSGEARCWGQNFTGQLGDGTTEDRARPRAVRAVSGPGHLRNVVHVVPSQWGTCAVLTSGQVRCWGDNTHGILGIGSTDYSDHVRPEVVVARTGSGPLTGVRSLDGGDEHVCAALANGQVRCWGRNLYGELGDGSYDARPRPSIVRRSDGTGRLGGVTSLATGRYHTCARLQSGQVRCWGGNQHGQLGDQTLSPRTLPVVVNGA